MNKRPIQLNLLTFHFPLTAIVSILHRLSGLFLFLMIPFFLWLLSASLKDSQGFLAIRHCVTYPMSKLFVLFFLAALFYHLLAGIRHVVMDLGFCEDLPVARFSAGLVIIITLLLVLLTGIYLW